MTNDYHDAVDDMRLNLEAMRVLGFSLAASPVPVHDLPARGVAQTFRSCVADAADASLDPKVVNAGKVIALIKKMIAQRSLIWAALSRQPIQ
jgi:hypothetical protein